MVIYLEDNIHYLSNVIKNRRSIRKYKNIDINKEIIIDIISHGILAPSAKNRQPWKSIIVLKEKKDLIADMMIKWATADNIKRTNKLLKSKNSVKETAISIKEASVLILIFREKDDNWINGDNLSIGACVENMCLRATELNLGSLWIRDTVHVDKLIEQYLRIDKNLELNCALAIGVKNENPLPRYRKKIEEIVKFY